MYLVIRINWTKVPLATDWIQQGSYCNSGKVTSELRYSWNKASSSPKKLVGFHHVFIAPNKAGAYLHNDNTSVYCFHCECMCQLLQDSCRVAVSGYTVDIFFSFFSSDVMATYHDHLYMCALCVQLVLCKAVYTTQNVAF